MAPDIAKVNTDRDLNLGLPAWNFSYEMLRGLLHGNSLLLPFSVRIIILDSEH